MHIKKTQTDGIQNKRLMYGEYQVLLKYYKHQLLISNSLLGVVVGR